MSTPLLPWRRFFWVLLTVPAEVLVLLLGTVVPAAEVLALLLEAVVRERHTEDRFRAECGLGFGTIVADHHYTPLGGNHSRD